MRKRRTVAPRQRRQAWSEGEAATWEGSSDTRLSEPDVPPGDVGQATDPMAGSAGETDDAAGGNAEPESGPDVERWNSRAR